MNAVSPNNNVGTRWLNRTILLVAVAALAACTTPVLRKPSRQAKPAVTKPAPARSASKAPSAGLQDFAGVCKQKELDGFAEDARLSVTAGRVRELDWKVKVGRRGQCNFNLNGFTQTKSSPHIELTSLRNRACRLMVYQEPRRVTLAHAGCASQCTNGVAEEAWPVMFNPKTGGCASLDR
ncbi:MAG: hypothetical protein Q4D19_12490 [Lautropia sp.]|nr:hypothetical protein [Lautropia sp.]